MLLHLPIRSLNSFLSLLLGKDCSKSPAITEDPVNDCPKTPVKDCLKDPVNDGPKTPVNECLKDPVNELPEGPGE